MRDCGIDERQKFILRFLLVKQDVVGNVDDLNHDGFVLLLLKSCYL